jgi:hypothetical protein
MAPAYHPAGRDVEQHAEGSALARADPAAADPTAGDAAGGKPLPSQEGSHRGKSLTPPRRRNRSGRSNQNAQLFNQALGMGSRKLALLQLANVIEKQRSSRQSTDESFQL